MDVRMPDGTVITGVPEGITQTELLARYQKFSSAQAPAEPASQPAAKEPEGGLARFASDFAKQFAAPVAAAPFQIPRGAELGLRGIARQSMEGEPEQIMPSSVYQPGLDTEEALFGQETPEQTARRKLQAQRALAEIPSIPGTQALSKLGDEIQKNIQNTISPEGKKALRESQITGNIIKGEVDFGKNPTAEGYALQVANVLGSMAVPMATTLLTKKPALGGAAGGAMAADEAGKSAAEYINKLTPDQLSRSSPLYAEMIAGGASPEEAKQLTVQKAAEAGAALQGLVATFGDAFTGKLLSGQYDNIIMKMAGKTRFGRAAGTGFVSGSEESLQETMEGLASDLGIKSVVKSKELGEDSAANLIMGFVGGAGPGGIRGLIANEEEPETKPKQPPETTPSGTSEPPQATGLPGLVPPTATAPAPVQTTPAEPPTLEQQIADMMNAATAPPAGQDESQDANAMLQELLTAKGEAGAGEVKQVTPEAAVQPTEEEAASGTQTPEAVQAEAQGQEAPEAKSKLTAPAGSYSPQDTFELDGRKWSVEAVAHTGKELTAVAVGGGPFRRERMNIGQAPEAPASNVIRATDLPDGMQAHVFKTDSGYGAGLYDKDSGQYVDGSIRRFTGDVAQAKAAGYAVDLEKKSKAKAPVAEEKFGEMSLEEFQAKHPKPYNVSADILRTDITAMSDQDVLDRFGRDDLVTLAKLLDTNTSGTKQTLLSNIRKVQANRDRMKGMTPEQIQAMSQDELKALVTDLGGNPAYKSKDALVKYATEWRDKSLGRTKEMVAESNHVKHVVQSVKSGNQNVSEENIRRYLPELWDAVDPDTQKDLYQKLLRKRAISLFVPPYMDAPQTIVSLRDEADRTEDQKQATKLTDLADALQGLYDKQSAKQATEVSEQAAEDESKMTPDDVFMELRYDERKGKQPDMDLIKGMDLETVKHVLDRYTRWQKNNVGAAFRETPLKKALQEHYDSLPKPDREEEYSKMMAEIKAKQGNEPTQMQKWEQERKRIEAETKRLKAEQEKEGTPVAEPSGKKPEAAEMDKLKQEMQDALGDLSMILTKGTRLNIVPEDEQKLLPVLTRVMDIAFRMGYIKFKEAAKYVLDTIRSKLGDDAADQISLDHLQGAYIGMAGKYQEQGASSKKEVVSVESLEELEEGEGQQVWSLSNPDQKIEVAKVIADELIGGDGFKSIVEARAFINSKFGIDIRPGTPTAKQADEAIEAGVVLAAQEIIRAGRKQGRSSEQIYERLVDLYNRQPNLAVRTSTSVENQAYSTPVPLAFLVSELAGITQETTVYEPTAGNGMLVIAANPKNLTLNELNQDRFDMLERLYPDATVTQGNALENDVGGSSFDVVIENPPFGKVGDISNIDHDIAEASLGALKKDGRAVLILGGVQATTEDGRREGYRSKAKREFYYRLYNTYNVVDHFTVGGNLYAKQGTTYPVDVIVIDGWGQKSQRDLPAADLPQLITSYEQLKEKLNEDRMVSGEPGRPGGTDGGVGSEGETGREGVGRGPVGEGGEPGAGRGEPAGGVKPGVSEAGPSVGGQPGAAGVRTGEGEPAAQNISEPGTAGGSVASTGQQATGRGKRGSEGRGPGSLGGVSVVSGERVESGLTSRVGEEQETAGQVTYTPHSMANAVGTLVPRAMADSIEQSLARVEAAEGNLDDYVARSLDMDPETVRNLFSAEQVDALSLAIRNAEEGKGFIIGDQTGVGKGRVVAAMIRYALINDKIPIFVTEAPNLYADMIRDLDDIGMTNELGLDTTNPKILITNNDEKIPYTLLRMVDGEITENNLVLKSAETKMDDLLKTMQQNDSLGDYKVIFTTYKQMQTVKGKVTERMRFLTQFGAGNYMIFDESHNAGGAGPQRSKARSSEQREAEGTADQTGRAAFVRKLVNGAFGTFFSSATYAKRPDVMDLYSSTDMKLAVERISDLADAIKQGGIPMQQTVAQMLTQVGQYIRRERTFAGVAYNTVETKVDKATAENMATAMRDILAFSRMKEAVVKDLQKEFDKQGAKLGLEGEKTKVQSANFGSTMHNLINQMLLSLKATDSVRHAIDLLEDGEKVVMTVANTMGSFLKNYADDLGLSAGDVIDLSFADLYMKYLEKQRIVTIKYPGGRTEQYRLNDQGLGPQMVAEYNRIANFIQNAGFGAAPISPIDYMHAELRKAGYKTDEITGRTMVVKYEGGKPTLTSRSSKIAQRLKAVKDFNNGNVDVLILNQAGSTGLSLHASSKFNDRRKRHMIIVQAEANIDIHMQMLGRVLRTGQVTKGPLDHRRGSIASRARRLQAIERRLSSEAKGKNKWKTELEKKKALESISNDVKNEREEEIGTKGTYLGKAASYGMPAYSHMMADIPAEMRPAAILLKKMASLNANTTASRKSAVTAEGAVDFMNDYGGQIVHEYLRDHPEVYEAIGGKSVVQLAEDPAEADETDIRKFTGYVPMLPIKQQEEIYKELVERYNELIEREDSMGTNKLEAKAVDLGAKTISAKQITEDKGDPSVFAQPAIMEQLDVKRTIKPFSRQEVESQSKENLKGLSTEEFRNLVLRDAKTRATDFGRSQVAAMQGAPKPDPVKIEKFKNDLNAQYDHVKTVIENYPIGSSVSIKNTNGVFVYGVVTNIEGKGKTRNPVAGSDWKMTLAIANGDAKSITINFSQIGTTYTLANEETVQWLNPETMEAERIPLVDMFDKGSQVRREKRWMVTGNILAGYAAVGNMGQILTYTKEDGTTAQGILMPRTFDFEKQQKNAPVKLGNVQKVMAFLDKYGDAEVGTENGVLKIRRRGNQYLFEIPKSKRDGGTYDGDLTLRKIIGEFTSTGGIKRSTVYYEHDLQKAIEHIISEREESFVAVNHKDEAREAFQVPLANVEPDEEMKMQNPYEALIDDRKKLIAEFAKVRQRRSYLVRKFSKGEAGLSEQRELNEIELASAGLKELIEDTAEEKRSALDVYRKAVDEFADGNISEDVFSVIETLYKKFPFVLEGLQLSVKKGNNDRTTGRFIAMQRIVRLYKGTNGVSNPITARHEIVHSLEQMMSPEAANLVIDAWTKALQKASKEDKSEKAQEYFQAILDFINDPSMATYEAALAALPSYYYYQYLNPSEFWAVNAEKLMARKLGTGWDRFVLSVKKLFEGLKSLIGFDNQYAIHKVFDDIMNARQGRVTRNVLVDYISQVSVPLENLNAGNTIRNYKGGPAPLATWTSLTDSNIDDFIYRIGDKHIDTKRVIQAITEEVGDIEDRFDVYMREELYHGRVTKQTVDFMKNELVPLLKEMNSKGIQLDEFETYLHNRAAKDRNAMVAARNPQLDDGGSGIKNDEVDEYMSKLSKEQKDTLEGLAKKIDSIVKGTQDILVDTGLEKAETIEKWRETQPHYVPMRRDENELDFVETGVGVGRGFSTRGSFSKMAAGSEKTVVDIFGNIALQRERAIIKSEKARVGRALYGLAITNPNTDFWKAVNPAAIKNKKKLEEELRQLGIDPSEAEGIISEPRVPRFDKKTGLVTYEVNPAMRNKDNVFAVRINGEDRFIFFNPGNPRAKRMVEALKNVDAHQLHDWLNLSAEVTRTYAALNTQYNPVFGAWNFARDTTAGAINLTGTPIENKRWEVFMNSFKVVRAIYRDLRSKGSTTPEMQKWIDLFERFQKVGGQTGYREQFSRGNQKATVIQRELSNLNAGNSRKAAKAVFDWLSDYNDAMENAVRLAAFKAALDEGLSDERAASLAKNLTVNFNRRGQMTTNLNAVYAFFNASVQGTARMAQLLVTRNSKGKYTLSKAGKKIIAGGMLIGVAQAVALSMAGFGDDEPPDFLKNKNLIIPIGGGKYLIVPMPLGLNVFPNIGRTLTEFAMSNRKAQFNLTFKVFGLLVDAFNPLGSSGLAQTISPTVIDPFVALAENKSPFGQKIYKENSEKNPTPGYMRNRESSTAVSQGLSYAINYMTGGGKYGIGMLSPTADQIDFLAAQYSGGIGREVMRAGRFMGAAASGEEIPPHKVPILGKLYGDTRTKSAVMDQFYNNVSMLAEHEGVIKRMREDHANTRQYMKDYPETKFIMRANNLENEISKLNKTRKELLQKPQTEQIKIRIKRIEDQRNRMMAKFNEDLKAAKQ